MERHKTVEFSVAFKKISKAQCSLQSAGFGHTTRPILQQRSLNLRLCWDNIWGCEGRFQSVGVFLVGENKVSKKLLCEQNHLLPP